MGVPGAGVGVGVEVGFCRLLIAYSAAPMIMPLVLSISDVSTRPFSSIPSEYPLVGNRKMRLNVRSHVLSEKQYYASLTNQLLI